MSTRERILETAAELFHSNSYDGVGVAELCARAEVNKGSFFHFFATKEDLLLAVIDFHGGHLSSFLAQSFRDDYAPLDRFRHHFGLLEKTVREHARQGTTMCGCPLGNLASELSTRTLAVRQKICKVFDGMRNVFRRTLREAVEAGELPETTDPNAVAGALVAYLQGLALVSKAYDNPRKLGGMTRYAFAIIGAEPTA